MAYLFGDALQEHTLSRFGWGFSPDQRVRYQALGHEAYLRQQLDIGGSSAEVRPDDVGELAELEPFSENLQPFETDPPAQSKRAAALMMGRAITQERQLLLVLSDLFFNHLNVFAGMGVAASTIDRYINEAIEAHVLGRFQDMLLASSKQPAMLQYLDNRTNFADAYNENYGRELLELHTVGVGAHDEHDVVAATRVMTGWTHKRTDADAEWRFNDARHDYGPDKVVLGVDYAKIGGPTRGEREVGRLLANLALHPSTAERIATKLIVRFVGEDAAQATRLRSRMSKQYLTTKGDLRSTVAHLALEDKEVNLAEHFRTRIKPPHRLVISAYRAFGVAPTIDRLEQLATHLRAAGDQPYLCSPPTGYPDTSSYWLTGNTMLVGFNMAEDLATDVDIIAAAKSTVGLSEADEPMELVQALYRHLFLGGDDNTVGFPRGSLRWSTIDAAIDYSRGAANLDDRIERALTILFSSPEFKRY